MHSNLTPLHDLELGPDDVYQVTGLTPRFNVTPADIKSLLGRWVLLRAKLVCQGSDFSSYLVLFDQDDKPTRIDLPVTFRGAWLELVFIPRNTCRIEFQPMSSVGSLSVVKFKVKPVSGLERYARMWQRVVGGVKTQPWARLKRGGFSVGLPFVDLLKAYQVIGRFRAYHPESSYSKWFDDFQALSATDVRRIKRLCADAKGEQAESWPRFKLVVQGAHQLAAEFILFKQQLAKQLYPRFDVVAELDGVDWVPGDWYVLVSMDVVLREHALFWLASVVRSQPHAKLIYSDHDVVDDSGKGVLHCFKPQWSVELLYSQPYIGGMLAMQYQPSLQFCQLGQLSIYEAALAWVYALEPVKPNAGCAVRIPAVLYHQKSALQSSPLAATDHSVRALQAHFKAHRVRADVFVSVDHFHLVRYGLNAYPLVSIIIPTRDGVDLLRLCVESILAKTQYERYEILIVDNGSVEAETFNYFEQLADNELVRVICYDKPFNYSAINNFAVQQAKGEVICLLNNDTEVITPGWLQTMLGHLQQPSVGAVGAKLLFDNHTVQHVGDAVGPGGCADHFMSGIDENDLGYCGRAVVAQDVSAVTAACLLTRKDVFEDLGGLDEVNLAVAFNDVDYCLRVREAGLRVVMTPFAKLYHHESVSRGKDDTPVKKARAKREADYMRDRWQRVLQDDPFYNPNLNYSRPDFKLSHAPMVDKPF